MKKVIVIGCPGSGKSTFSKALHDATGLPLYHLDMMKWNADGTSVPKCTFMERLHQALEKESVAEDRWSFSRGGYFLAVTIEGAVYVSDLDSGSFVNYCAAGFPQFMEIMKLYQAALETTPSPDVDDEEGYQYCKEVEQTLRKQIVKIDSTAIKDTESFWSTCIEELGYGM